jgi:hypothetical protein
MLLKASPCLGSLQSSLPGEFQSSNFTDHANGDNGYWKVTRPGGVKQRFDPKGNPIDEGVAKGRLPKPPVNGGNGNSEGPTEPEGSEGPVTGNGEACPEVKTEFPVDVFFEL